MSTALETKNMTIQFGSIKVADNINIKIEKGQLAGLIGPNGAGKTTAFNLITGVYQPTAGEIEIFGKNTLGMKPYQVAGLGISRTFQNIRLFKRLSVLENVLIAAHQHVEYGMGASILMTKSYEDAEKKSLQKAMDLLSVFNLADKANENSVSLPYGDQRKLEIVRALASDPKILLLDEPAAGMNHSETHELMKTVEKLRKDFDLTVLLIEHDMKFVMGICEKIFVLDHGVKIEEGTPEVIRKSAKVIEAYLGAEHS